MIERINFIEKEPFRFTYAKLATGMAVVAFILVALFGSQAIIGSLKEKKLKVLNAEISMLKNRQETLFASESAKTPESGMTELKNIFTKSPQWSLVIGDIGVLLPGTVWLTSLKGSTQEIPQPKKDSENKKRKTETASPPPKALILKGVARTPAELALFLDGLRGSKYIANAVLAGSKAEESGFTFSIECDLVLQNSGVPEK